MVPVFTFNDDNRLNEKELKNISTTKSKFLLALTRQNDIFGRLSVEKVKAT